LADTRELKGPLTHYIKIGAGCIACSRPPPPSRWSGIRKRRSRRVGVVCDFVNRLIDALSETLILPDARLAAGRWTWFEVLLELAER
jgi:hypothetical protein